MQQITIKSPPPQKAEKDLSEEDIIITIDDGPVMDTYNLTYV